MALTPQQTCTHSNRFLPSQTYLITSYTFTYAYSYIPQDFHVQEFLDITYITSVNRRAQITTVKITSSQPLPDIIKFLNMNTSFPCKPVVNGSDRCFSYQKWSLTAPHCQFPYICFFLWGSHQNSLSKKRRTKSPNIICINCSLNHPTTYLGCTQYQKAHTDILQKARIIPPFIPLPTQTTQQLPTPTLTQNTYASALNPNIHSPNTLTDPLKIRLHTKFKL